MLAFVYLFNASKGIIKVVSSTSDYVPIDFKTTTDTAYIRIVFTYYPNTTGTTDTAYKLNVSDLRGGILYSSYMGGVIRLIDWIYPVGHVITTVNPNYDPNNIFKTHTWVRFAQGKTLVGVDESDTDFNIVGKIGGEKAHKLTYDELANHRHTIIAYSASGNDYSASDATLAFNYSGTTKKGWAGYTASIGNDKAHNNLQPYETVFYWKRTA